MPTLARARVSELASALRPATMRLARRMRSERSDTDLTLSQLSALGTLARHGAMAPGELAAHEKVKAPSMSRVLTVLEERALVVRAPHPSDGRQVVLSLSPDGTALLKEDRRRRDVWLARQLAELSPDERELLAAAVPLMDRLATA